MSVISSNFSSFFLDSLEPSEFNFAKYLGNASDQISPPLPQQLLPPQSLNNSINLPQQQQQQQQYQIQQQQISTNAIVTATKFDEIPVFSGSNNSNNINHNNNNSNQNNNNNNNNNNINNNNNNISNNNNNNINNHINNNNNSNNNNSSNLNSNNSNTNFGNSIGNSGNNNNNSNINGIGNASGNNSSNSSNNVNQHQQIIINNSTSNNNNNGVPDAYTEYQISNQNPHVINGSAVYNNTHIASSIIQNGVPSPQQQQPIVGNGNDGIHIYNENGAALNHSPSIVHHQQNHPVPPQLHVQPHNPQPNNQNYTEASPLQNQTSVPMLHQQQTSSAPVPNPTMLHQQSPHHIQNPNHHIHSNLIIHQAPPPSSLQQQLPINSPSHQQSIPNHQSPQPLHTPAIHQNQHQYEFSKYLKHSEYGDRIPVNHTIMDVESSQPPPSQQYNSTPKRSLVISCQTITPGRPIQQQPQQPQPLPPTTPIGSSSNSSISNLNTNSNASLTEIETFDYHHNSNESSNNSGICPTTGQLLSSNASDGGGSSDTNQSQQSNDKPLAKFTVNENFDAHPAHKVEDGIFQHMNKLPVKKKENLKQLGVTFTGHMSVNDKSIIVDNFARFCEEYQITDHRPFLALNQSGMLKPEQIKFARYLGQGLPNFTLFCIYSNFKNLFCTKRFENYSKGSYNLQYILDKTRHFLTCTTADLKNLPQQQISEGICDPQQQQQLQQPQQLPQQQFHSHPQQPPMLINHSNTISNNNNNGVMPTNLNPQQQIINNSNNTNITSQHNIKQDLKYPKALERLTIYENYDVHESHLIEDGIFTHISRLSPKKQEILKQFGISSNHTVSYFEKHIIIENFIKFCNEYYITDHRPFLDFNDSGFPKSEQIKFVRYLGRGLPNLTLYKIYSAFKDLLALNRIEKMTADGYDLQTILKKKKKNVNARMHAAGRKSHREAEAAAAKQQQDLQMHHHHEMQIHHTQQQQEMHMPQVNNNLENMQTS